MSDREKAADSNGNPGILFVLTVFGLIALGIALRLAQYLHNRALWLDEAALALQVVYKSPEELLGPLSWHQNSPLGFLLSVKFLTGVFGTSEYALRLLPVVSGVLAVPLFAWWLSRVSRGEKRFRWEVVFAGVALFAVGKHLIYYSSEFRHYSADVMAVCLLLLAAHWALRDEQLRWMRLGVLFLLGLGTTWFLLAPIFVLGGIAGAYCLTSLAARDFRRVAVVAAIGLVWLGSFWLHARIHAEHVEARGLSEEIETLNAMSWAPVPVASYDDAKWYREAFEFMFYHPVGLTYRGLGGFAFLAGLVALWRRDRRLFLLLTLPFLFVLAASALHRYPFRDRYLHFAAPLLIWGIAEGVGMLADRRWLGTRLVGGVLLLMLVLQPAVHALRIFGQPRGGYEIKPLLAYMKEHWHEEDGAYIPLKTVPQFMYYWPRIDFGEVAIPDELYYGQTGRDFPGLDSARLVLEPSIGTGVELSVGGGALPGWRAEHLSGLLARSHSVWMLYEHDAGPPIATAIGEVDATGELIGVVHSDGATLYRYRQSAD